jgi:hypothetical protein
MSRALAGCALALALLAPTACESTQAKSAAKKAKGAKLVNQKGLDVKQRNNDIQIVGKQIIHDANGTAVVIVMRSRAAAPLRRVPIEIEVTGAGGKTLFKNDQPGVDKSLVGPSILPPGQEFAWVHDQVVTAGKALAVKATPGAAQATVTGELPKLEVSRPQLHGDPTSGIEATGTVTNASKVEQQDLVLYCIARKGANIVAAGRGGVPRLKVGQKRSYHVFFIGDPRGAKLSMEAPPTVLKPGES